MCSGKGLIRSPSLSRIRERGQFRGGVEMALMVGPQGRGRAARPAQALEEARLGAWGAGS